ncbi:fibronectin type III domain-containing protein [archaeon]|nr:MAG: fibronectin type III domain-containing protein [archaeon]
MLSAASRVRGRASAAPANVAGTAAAERPAALPPISPADSDTPLAAAALPAAESSPHAPGSPPAIPQASGHGTGIPSRMAKYIQWREQQMLSSRKPVSADRLTYIVSVHEVGSAWYGNWRVVGESPAGASVFDIRGLPTSKLFEFRVAAKSKLGVGAYTQVSLPVYIPATEHVPSAVNAPCTPDLLRAAHAVGCEQPTAASVTPPPLPATEPVAYCVYAIDEPDTQVLPVETSRGMGAPTMDHREGRGPGDGNGDGYGDDEDEDEDEGWREMEGADDVRRCCGCEAGCAGWFDWLLLWWESTLLRPVDRVLFPRPVANFLESMASTLVHTADALPSTVAVASQPPVPSARRWSGTTSRSTT